MHVSLACAHCLQQCGCKDVLAVPFHCLETTSHRGCCLLPSPPLLKPCAEGNEWVPRRVHPPARAGSRTLFATHYHSLTRDPDVAPLVAQAHMAHVVDAARGGFRPLHCLRPGAAPLVGRWPRAGGQAGRRVRGGKLVAHRTTIYHGLIQVRGLRRVPELNGTSCLASCLSSRRTIITPACRSWSYRQRGQPAPLCHFVFGVPPCQACGCSILFVRLRCPPPVVCFAILRGVRDSTWLRLPASPGRCSCPHGCMPTPCMRVQLPHAALNWTARQSANSNLACQTCQRVAASGRG
jgi:hypothetical protein